jgi:urease accessory protein
MAIEPRPAPARRSLAWRRREPVALTSAGLLRLLWLASPALPVGGFSYSEGLEAAIDSGAVSDEHSAGDWLLDQLALAQARSDLAVVAKAIAAWRRGDAARITELNDWVRLTRESHEWRLQTEQMGRSMLAWLRQRRVDAGGTATAAELASTGGLDGLALLGALQPAPCWPLAWSLAAAQSGAPLREALLCHAFGWAENMVQAAVKALPLGQSAGQRVLQRLAEAIPAAVDRAIALPDSARQAFTPMLAILSARHEAQYSRLFRS